MTTRDLHNNIKVSRAISPVVVGDDTAQVSQIIDTQGYGSCEFIIAAGTLADANATFTSKIEDGDAANLSDAAEVADADLIGTEAGASFKYDDDDKVFKIGYIGKKRYVRLTITPSGNSGNAPIAAIVVLGNPNTAPVA